MKDFEPRIAAQNTAAMQDVYSPALMGAEASAQQIAMWQRLGGIYDELVDSSRVRLFDNAGRNYPDQGAGHVFTVSDAARAARRASYWSWRTNPNGNRSLVNEAGITALGDTVLKARAIKPSQDFEFTVDERSGGAGLIDSVLTGTITAVAMASEPQKPGATEIITASDWKVSVRSGGDSDIWARASFVPEIGGVPNLGFEAATAEMFNLKRGEKLASRVLTGEASPIAYDTTDPDIKAASHAIAQAMIRWLTQPGYAVLTTQVDYGFRRGS